MQPAVDQATLARLLAHGRAQGHLTTEDLRRALPVNVMQAEDLALVVAHLEDEGVPVELDESLFLGGPASDAAPPRGFELSAPPRDAPPPAPPLRAEPSGVDAAASPAPAALMSSKPYAHKAVWIAGAVVFALLALALLALTG